MTTPITFIVPGQAQSTRSATVAHSLPAGFTEGQVRYSVQLSARRAAGAEVSISAEPGKDVVVLHIANGPVLVLHPETARDLFLAQSTALRGGDMSAPTQVHVSAQLRWQGLEKAAVETRGATRGFLGDVFLSLLQVVRALGKDQAVDLTTEGAVRLVDGQVDAGVYRLDAHELPRLKARGGKLEHIQQTKDGKPLLVLLHGTFSNTQGTFGKLWSEHPTRVAALFERYAGQVYALDHATLGESPIGNALMLAQALPVQARVHLLSHSRGGLVGEVLARVCGDVHAASETALEGFSGAKMAAQRQELVVLAELVREKGIQVERFVRVACPARGTLLASKRLDAYVSVLKWGLELAGVPVFPGILSFLAAVAQRRSDPALIPGLEAQMPESALVRWLHRIDESIPGELRVIAGDMEGDSIGSWLKTLLSDAYYWTDNDLVVQTSSMYGGAPRRETAEFLLDRGSKVSHFSYFSNARTSEAIVNGLVQENPQGFRIIGPLSWEGRSTSGDRGPASSKPASTRPAVILLPGILGSNLKVGQHRVWISPRLVNGLDDLAYRSGEDDQVEPDGPVGLVYDDLIGFLSGSHDVIRFGYDWRLPLEEEARRLAKEVTRELDFRQQSNQPVRLIAHSMGGLLARTMQLEQPQVWERMMARSGACLLMLGTPNQGSWAPMQVLSGDDSFGNGLAYVGAPFNVQQARQVMAGMPGFLQLQAGMRANGRPLSDPETWASLASEDRRRLQALSWWHNLVSQLDVYAWGLPSKAVLDQAVGLRKRLDEQDLAAYRNKLVLVVGHSNFTPDGYAFDAKGLSYLDAKQGGDGRVTLGNAILPGVRTWKLNCAHGDLPKAKEAFPAFLELLQNRQTKHLEELNLVEGMSRGEVSTELAPLVHVRHRRVYESSSRPPESVGEIFGITEPADYTLPAAIKAPLAVTVLNGNLKFIRQPLLVGHYIATSLTGAERVVDELIGGVLGDSLKMGCYPGRPGTHQIFLNVSANADNPLQMPRPQGVIVVGLGEEGKLNAGDLMDTVRKGVIAWAQRLMELHQGIPVRFELAATLLGSGGLGISAAQAAGLVAQAVRDANQRLCARNWPNVTHLYLAELYQDRATDAWRALQVMAEAKPGEYEVSPALELGIGSLRRPLDWGYRSTSYDFISVISQFDTNGLPLITYTLDTKRARAEVHAQAMQGKLLRSLVSISSNEVDRDSEVGRTLFKLLVPVEMEPFLSGTTEMQIELDESTAGIPWEMLETDGDGSDDVRPLPWAIRSKLLRRLRTADFRNQVKDAGRDSHVLIIGEPDAAQQSQGEGGPLYPRLPGARAEANAVLELFRMRIGDRSIKSLISSDDKDVPGIGAQEVVRALLLRDWRIVHIAGHGEPPELDEATSEPNGNGARKLKDPRGVVLSHGIYLGPREIKNMRIVPELVFVNCCHLAARDPNSILEVPNYDRAHFAATVADELIRIGVRCVVAAGWAVDDGAAAAFAQSFYSALLAGKRFLDAVATARRTAWEESLDASGNPTNNTWAAYQCYGDPDWRFIDSETEITHKPKSLIQEFESVASPAALVLALETLIESSRYQPGDGYQRREKIQYLEHRFFARWGDLGEVAEAFGMAWAESGDVQRAIECYERAVAANDGSATLKSSEQLSSLRTMSAWQDLLEAQQRTGWKRGDKNLPAAMKTALSESREKLQGAAESLSWLAKIHPSVERLCACGAAYQRLAMIEELGGRGEAERRAIETMGDRYADAEKLAGRRNDGLWCAPALQKIAADLAAGRGGKRWLEKHAQVLLNLRVFLQQSIASDPDFESVAALILLGLYEALAGKRLAEIADELEAEFENLYRRVPAVMKWGVLYEQLDFVLSRYALTAASGESTAALQLLQQMQGRVQASA